MIEDLEIQRMEGEGGPAPKALENVPVAPRVKKIQFTGKVRRGLFLIHLLTINACDADKAPGSTNVKLWSKALQSDFNAAMDWMEQNQIRPEGEIKGE